MTLLNTVTNLGGNWPSTLALWLVDSLTWKECQGAVGQTCASPEAVGVRTCLLPSSSIELFLHNSAELHITSDTKLLLGDCDATGVVQKASCASFLVERRSAAQYCSLPVRFNCVLVDKSATHSEGKK